MSFAMDTAKEMLETWAKMNMPVFNPVPHTCIVALQFGSHLIPDARNLDYDYAKNAWT
jgi:hypothetical protein